ncbi:MAG: hypothetical protein RJB24_181 [Candidatus Parcubacteria bacterium]
MSFKLRFGMNFNSLVSKVSCAYDKYILSHSVDDGKTLYDQVINVFRYVSTMGEQNVQVLSTLFDQYPVLGQACEILAKTTPTAQDTRKSNFLVSRPTPS